jgi:hypothetical protein
VDDRRRGKVPYTLTRYAWLARRQLVDDRRRGKVLRDTGLLDPDYPTGHFDSIIQTMTQIFEVTS